MLIKWLNKDLPSGSGTTLVTTPIKKLSGYVFLLMIIFVAID
jgi:hypothetical protein